MHFGFANTRGQNNNWPGRLAFLGGAAMTRKEKKWKEDVPSRLFLHSRMCWNACIVVVLQQH
jgi:hypothetical protein